MKPSARSSEFPVLKLLAVALAAMALLTASPRAARANSASAEWKSVDAKDIKALVAQNKGKVVLLNFFATWCVPCHKEFPDIVKLDAKYRAQGLQVIEVSVNEADEKEAMQKFMEEQKPPFAVYLATSYDDEFCAAVDPRWDTALPMTMIFDRDGNARYFYKDARTFEQFEKDITPLLAAAPSK